MSHKLYVRLIKEAMENIDKAGQITKDQNVEMALKELASIGNESINKTIQKYMDKKDDLITEYNIVNNKLIKLIDETFKAILEIPEENV